MYTALHYTEMHYTVQYCTCVPTRAAGALKSPNIIASGVESTATDLDLSSRGPDEEEKRRDVFVLVRS